MNIEPFFWWSQCQLLLVFSMLCGFGASCSRIGGSSKSLPLQCLEQRCDRPAAAISRQRLKFAADMFGHRYQIYLSLDWAYVGPIPGAICRCASLYIDLTEHRFSLVWCAKDYSAVIDCCQQVKGHSLKSRATAEWLRECTNSHAATLYAVDSRLSPDLAS